MSNFTVEYTSYFHPDEYRRIKSIFITIIYPVFLIPCICGNILNLYVFIKMGLKDSVNISFLILSLSDLSYLLINSAVMICYGIEYTSLRERFSFNVMIVGIGIVFYEYVFFDYSILVTTYIAVTRCCCVAMALKFRNVFTVTRTYISLGITFWINLVLKLPVLYSIRLGYTFDSKTNKTGIGLLVDKNWISVRRYHDIVNQNCIPYVTTAIVLTCMGIRVHKLLSASRKRSHMTSGKSSVFNREQSTCSEDALKQTGKDLSNKTEGSNLESSPENGSSLSSKDAQVIKVVVLVSAFFVMNVFYFAFKALARNIRPELAGTKIDLYHFLGDIGYTISHINAGINPVIYYNFNSKYRQICRSWLASLCCQRYRQ